MARRRRRIAIRSWRRAGRGGEVAPRAPLSVTGRFMARRAARRARHDRLGFRPRSRGRWHELGEHMLDLGSTDVQPLEAYRPLELMWCEHCQFAFRPEGSVDSGRSTARSTLPTTPTRAAIRARSRERGGEATGRVAASRGRTERPAARIGCAGGFFLGETKAAGWDVVGVEPAEAMAAEARQRSGATVHTGSSRTSISARRHSTSSAAGMCLSTSPSRSGTCAAWRRRFAPADGDLRGPELRRGQFAPARARLETLGPRPPRRSLLADLRAERDGACRLHRCHDDHDLDVPLHGARRLAEAAWPAPPARHATITGTTTFGDDPLRHELLRVAGTAPAKVHAGAG